MSERLSEDEGGPSDGAFELMGDWSSFRELRAVSERLSELLGLRGVVVWLVLCMMPLAGVAQGALVASVEDLPDAPGGAVSEDGATNGSLFGVVKDSNGALVVGAKVQLAGRVAPGGRETASGADGGFRFEGLQAGGFTLTVNSVGLATWVTSGVLHTGESVEVQRIGMTLSKAFANVTVLASQQEIAAAQVNLEEKQRVLGVFPNFYATYIWNAAPLTRKQKFGLAWKSATDPVTFALTGVTAGVEQANNDYSGYGQGAQGYAKRFGASYADGFTSTMIGGAILPSLFRQDPRYFYKGTGSVVSRAEYAVAMVVVCRGDNGKWQPNYSNVLGNLATGGISNIYYPASDRNGARLTINNALIGTAAGAVQNLIQEFVIRRITPHIPDYGPSKKASVPLSSE
ncbi:carboxypeptidase-like regulatory domain-containing protein [Granulicella sibirica]|uniref:carboxypeptidase-like regulatory domain-containing protein n=1 Tax=Granulicella sibirica TaxID=2479048 RepID=UPI001375E638|nr:carboxypeptidase-like regulatory domain-containing protein [Granulicella sibirica]